MTRPVLRLLADDLTGALDSAAEFSALAGPVPVLWNGTDRGTGNLAFATATREATRREAIDRVTAAAPLLADADIAFKKLDSLLRGHPAAELAACLKAGAWRSVVVAPAFPPMGRVTRGGVQQVRGLGVVGHQPLLKPGEQFEYTSWAQIATPQGSMQGRFFCITEDADWFESPLSRVYRKPPNATSRLEAMGLLFRGA